jgi:hypothetical protein
MWVVVDQVAAPAAPRFGDRLRRWRIARRMSQLTLATEAEIPSCHLSFLETGRAQPSREMVLPGSSSPSRSPSPASLAGPLTQQIHREARRRHSRRGDPAAAGRGARQPRRAGALAHAGRETPWRRRRRP